ncbi:uncharacterized protein LOC126810947 isoform X3 [Patella vulgata]|uniref:uncharacterized protein LOC126810947 isoform X3 n=1 Tax=Patella vulgata TaxID=6465 RepID=UPI0024A994E6|nr:uncharacterized protein LOC126810947 isoform X3 [Patella vulgata]
MSYNDLSEAALVIDHGSGTSKVGFAGDDEPRAVFPTVTASPKSQDSSNQKGCYVGDDVPGKRDMVYIRYPIEHGIITRWDEMERIWHHIFHNVLCKDPEERPVLLTEPPFNPKINREKMTQVMFETFNTPALCVSIQSILSLYASGRTTGVVCDSAHGISNILPVYDGHGLIYKSRKFEIAGGELTDYLRRALNERGYNFTAIPETDIVRSIKEKLCYVAVDYQKDMDESSSNISSFEELYELPGGEVITVGKERFMCPEVLFQPSIDSFTDRMLKEVKYLAPTSANISITSGRKHSAWIGGSMLARLSTFLPRCISKDEYDEYGPSIVHKKCY